MYIASKSKSSTSNRRWAVVVVGGGRLQLEAGARGSSSSKQQKRNMGQDDAREQGPEPEPGARGTSREPGTGNPGPGARMGHGGTVYSVWDMGPRHASWGRVMAHGAGAGSASRITVGRGGAAWGMGHGWGRAAWRMGIDMGMLGPRSPFRIGPHGAWAIAYGMGPHGAGAGAWHLARGPRPKNNPGGGGGGTGARHPGCYLLHWRWANNPLAHGTAIKAPHPCWLLVNLLPIPPA
jgi:hypothetical protein